MKEIVEKVGVNYKRIPAQIFVLVGLCLLGGVAYGGLVFTGGVFGDDPNALYAYQRLGREGFDAFYGWARPFSTWMHKLVIPLTGINMRRINLVTIGLRVLSSWMLYLLMRAMGEESEEMAWMGAALALVYPGFGQQAQAVQYLLHFSVLALVLFSLWAMVRGIKAHKRVERIAWVGAALIGACAQVSIEYFIGLELARPVVLGIHLWEREGKAKWQRAFWRHYMPFAVFLAGYLIWRIVIFKPAYPQITLVDKLQVSPLEAVPEGVLRMGRDLMTVMVGAWVELIRVLRRMPVRGWMLAAGTAGAGIGLVILLCLDKSKKIDLKGVRNRILLIGGCMLVFGGVPLWASETPLTVTHPWNRTTLCFLSGVSMVSSGLLALLSCKIRRVLFIVLVGLAVIFQAQIGADYAREWALVQDLFTQLTEQVPQLKAGTLVLYDDFPFRYYSANNLNALLNWTYDPERGAGDEQYKLFEIDERLGGALPALEADILVTHGTFRGNTSQTLVIALDSERKLMILDREKVYTVLPGRTREAVHLSVPGEVILEDTGQAQFPCVLAARVE